MAQRKRLGFLLALTISAGLLAIQCRPGGPEVTPTPTKTRIVPSVPTATLVVPTDVAMATKAAAVSDTPSPQPTASPSTTPPLPSATSVPPTATPVPPTETPTPFHSATPIPASPTVTPTATPSSPPPTRVPPTATKPAQPPLAPQEGGEWDMEAGFEVGTSPLGEICPGWAVAVGWQAFLSQGNPASSCLNENKHTVNVYSGERSQEMTFDFISAQAGIYKRARTIPGHRYQVEAWGKHVRSQSPVELTLGVDLNGGEDWQAASVTWHPWDETGEEVWVHTQVTVEASGGNLTVFLKGYHPFAAQGGATMFDSVRVVDLGP